MQDTFVPGVRRRHAIVSLHRKEGETEAEQRQRVQHCIKHVRKGTISQPPGLLRAQPELPLKALRCLRELEPFVTGQERELVGQAMADLATWSTQFWGHPVTLAHNDAGHEVTQMDQQEEEEREPAARPGHTETMWRSMVESSEGNTHERETLVLLGRRAPPAGHLLPSGVPGEGGPPQEPAGLPGDQLSNSEKGTTT